MNAAISARKILRKLKLYRSAESAVSHSALAHEVNHLGRLLGTYTNEGYNLPTVEVYDFGVRWSAQQGIVEVPYTEIHDIGFTDGKQSLSLALTLKSGVQQELPVAGNNGKVFDCFAMHRFLRNVASDAIRFPEEWKRN